MVEVRIAERHCTRDATRAAETPAHSLRSCAGVKCNGAREKRPAARVLAGQRPRFVCCPDGTPAALSRGVRFWKRMGLLVLGLSAAGFAVYTALTPGDRAVDAADASDDGAAAQLRYVEVATAALAERLAPLPAPGRVALAESRVAPVVAALAGRVEKVSVKLGDVVTAGQRLVAVRSARLPELAREIELGRASVGVRRAAVTRARELLTYRAIAAKDLMAAQAELQEAEIALATAEGKRRSLRLEGLDREGLYWLTAPRAGTVVEYNVLVGMQVGPERAAPLLSVADLDEVLVIADLREREVTDLRPGQTALIITGATAAQAIRGVVDSVGATVDPVRRTIGVRIRVPNSTRALRPHALVHVTFELPPRRLVVIDAGAVVTDGSQRLVFVRAGRGADERYDKREVKIGRSEGGRTEILEGLQPGEAYVLRGALLLLNALALER
jgi:cobalt-zinc-cadmium efflux system membrane fusion protein